MGLFGSRNEIDYTRKEQKAIWSWIKAFENYHKEMNKLLPRIFKRLQQLEANSQQIAKNQQTLINHFSTVEKTLEAMKEKDRQFAAMFQNLATVSTEAVKIETEGDR